MGCKATPYEGNEPYLFFSYCREDSEIVYPIIEQMAKDGFRIWYDDGIHVGDDWPQKIANHLKNALICIAAITQNADNSHNCRSELLFSLNHNKKVIPIFLEEFSITPALEYLLGSVQYMKKYELPNEDMFYEKVYNVKQMSTCRGTVSLLKTELEDEKKEPEELSEGKETVQISQEFMQDLDSVSKVQTSEVDVREEKTQPQEDEEKQKQRIQVESEEDKTQIEEIEEEDKTVVVETKKKKPILNSKEILQSNVGNRTAIFCDFSSKKFFVLNKKQTKIGRSEKKCDIVLSNPAISSLHAVIFYETDEFYIRDSDSTNGTILNLMEKIEGLQPIQLRTNTLISLDSELCFFAQDNFAEWILKNKKCAVLECEETDDIVVIDSEVALLFGRSNSWIKGALSDKHISREIGYIFLENDKCFLEMMKKNEVSKTFLNGKLLRPSETVELQDGDELVMGMTGIYHMKFHWLELERGE